MRKIKTAVFLIMICFITLFCLVSCSKDNLVENNQKNPHEHVYIDGICSCGESIEKEEKETTFVVGSAMMMGKSFLTSGIFSSGDNISTIKKLINDYTPIVYTKNEKYEINNTVVKDIVIEEINEIGTKYTIKLFEDLKWSNGAPLSAKDYVGSIMLFNNSLFFETMGQKILPGIEVIGTEEYFNDKSGLGELVGVELIGDYEFSFIVEEEASLKNMDVLLITPYPVDVLLPGVTIKQGEKGTKFTGKTTEELKSILYNTVENDFKGYRYFPNVTCGPYKLESLENEQCVLIKNENYKGNYEGQRPKIDRIVIKTIDINGPVEKILTSLQNGEIDFYDSNIESKYLEKIDTSVIKTTSFDFINVMTLAFHCDKGAVRFKEVRHAIAYLMNRENINGDYNLNQWMAKESQDAEGNVLGINGNGEKVPLNKYEFNIKKAIELIEQAGYIYGDEKASRLYTSSDVLRYRKNSDGTVEPLVLDIMLINEYKNVFDELINNAGRIGFKINIMLADSVMYTYDYYYAFKGDGYDNSLENISYEEILNSYNPDSDERIGNAYLHHKTYNTIIDNASYYTSLDNWGDKGNIYFLYDEDLDKAAKVLDSAKTMEEYLEAWQGYQYYFNENLPTIPISTRKRMLVFTNKVVGLENTLSYNWDWTYQVLYCEKN